MADSSFEQTDLFWRCCITARIDRIIVSLKQERQEIRYMRRKEARERILNHIVSRRVKGKISTLALLPKAR